MNEYCTVDRPVTARGARVGHRSTEVLLSDIRPTRQRSGSATCGDTPQTPSHTTLAGAMCQ
jgi:hypothetical protein